MITEENLERNLLKILPIVLSQYKKEEAERPTKILVSLSKLPKYIGMNIRYIKKALEEGVIKRGYYLNSEVKTELFDPEEVIQQIKDYNLTIKTIRK